MFTDIVVGAGSSGSVIAGRLSEDPARRVLLIEAGPDYSGPGTTPADLRNGKVPVLTGHDWGWHAVDPRGRRQPVPRGKVVGGSSAINTCIALRPAPADFDRWHARGVTGWQWPDMLRHLVGLESDQDHGGDAHGRTGPIPIRRWRAEELLPPSGAVLQACLELGHRFVTDHNGGDVAGVGMMPMNTVDTRRVSAADGYLPAAGTRTALIIRADTLVDRILISHGRATGVEIVSGQTRERVFAERIIVCAGAYGTPLLLMRSGLGAPDALRAWGITPVAELPGVGAGLSDHSQVPVALAARPGVTDDTVPCAQVLLRFTAPGSAVRNDMQLCALNYVDLPAYAPELTARIGSRPAFMICANLMDHRSAGSVTLTGADPGLPPRIALDHVADPEDLRRYRAGVRLAWDVAQSAPVRQHTDEIVNLDNATVASDRALDAFIRSSVRTAHHPAGTARMGPASDPMAVVDDRCRVHGVEDLLVADASIMPVNVRVNTNLTCLLIGEHVAQMLRARPLAPVAGHPA